MYFSIILKMEVKQMKNFSTWMLVMFMVMFWAFRVIVAIMPEFGTTLGGIVPMNNKLEIGLCFVVLVCMILIVKRKMIGALIYLLAYGMYFGVDFINNIGIVMEGASTRNSFQYFHFFYRNTITNSCIIRFIIW